MALPKRWRQHIEQWQSSELAQADYCRQHGLNRKTFSARLSEFRSGGLSTPSAVLIPVQVGQLIILNHAKGHRLELPATVTASWLGELLRCLD
jgi:hypothetical protein